jgi:hypothetical protein
MWQETYISALLRAILYSDDPVYGLEAYRKLDPITTPEGELRFLQAAEALFLKGEISVVLFMLIADVAMGLKAGRSARNPRYRSLLSFRITWCLLS